MLPSEEKLQLDYHTNCDTSIADVSASFILSVGHLTANVENYTPFSWTTENGALPF